MKKPKMILFDYGQTIISEDNFDGIKATNAILKYASKNKYNISAERIFEEAQTINKILGRFDTTQKHLFQIEVPNIMFTKYLYESLGITLDISSEEIDRIFWNTASPGRPTENILEFLQYLKNQNIRTGVISNISYNNIVVKERINNLIINNNFEFIITSSEFMFRKPNKRIFELALEKTDLKPDDVWYIGDNYQCDVIGSRSAGLTPIWYLGASNKLYDNNNDDVITIKNWLDLIQIMKENNF